MKLKFTRKTWYFFLLVAAGASMINGLAVLFGVVLADLETVAFALTGITALFLAAEKDSTAQAKRRYFLVFVLLMLSYLLVGWAGYLASALAWPVLLGWERKSCPQLEAPLRLVCLAEAMHLVFVLLSTYGGFTTFYFWANILWVLLAVARGWGALTLYKAPAEDA